MKYTHSDIVDSIKARKKGENTLSWIEKYGIYLCKTFKNIDGSVLVLSIENVDNLSVYDCYFKSKGERTKFFVNKAIESVPFAEISSLLKSVKCFDSNTQQYWNECFCKGQFDQIVDTLQRPETKASSDPSVDLTMSKFLSELQNLVEKAIEGIAKTAESWNKYDRIYIASADGKNTYPLVLPLKYTLYNLFKTDSKKIWGETFRVKDKEGKSIKKPLSSYNYDWKDFQQYFHTGALSRAIGLNTSVEVSLNDLMNAGGVVVTFPLDENNGCYTMPATPVLRECSSDSKKCEDTKTLSLGDVTLTWADLYGQVQWDYKVGELAFKQVKLSIYADGCQRLYLMDCDKVLTVISSNGSTVEVENCLKASIAEPATIVEELEVDTSVMATTLDKPKDNPTKVAEGIGGGTKSSTSRADLLILKANLNGKIQSVLTALNELMRDEAKRYIEKYYPDKTFGLLYDSWIYCTRYDGQSYNKKLILDWEYKKQNNETWETDSKLKYLDYTNYYVFIEQQFLNLTKEWNIDKKRLNRIKENINYLKDKIRHLSSHQYVDDFTQEDLISTLTYVSEIIKVLEKNPAERKKLVGSVIDAQTDALIYYKTLKNK